MVKIPAGWKPLVTAQLLWTKSKVDSCGLIIPVQISRNDPRIDFATDEKMPKSIRRWMCRLRRRALFVAMHTCEVCGVATPQKFQLPVRCEKHIPNDVGMLELDVEDISNSSSPLEEIFSIAVRSPDLALLGDCELAAELISGSPDLLCAANALHECRKYDDPWAAEIAHTVLRSIQLAPKTQIIGYKKIAGVIQSVDVVERFARSQTLMAAARVWAEHGPWDLKRKKSTQDALLLAEALRARQSIDKMLSEQLK